MENIEVKNLANKRIKEILDITLRRTDRIPKEMVFLIESTSREVQVEMLNQAYLMNLINSMEHMDSMLLGKKRLESVQLKDGSIISMKMTWGKESEPKYFSNNLTRGVSDRIVEVLLGKQDYASNRNQYLEAVNMIDLEQYMKTARQENFKATQIVKDLRHFAFAEKAIVAKGEYVDTPLKAKMMEAVFINELLGNKERLFNEMEIDVKGKKKDHWVMVSGLSQIIFEKLEQDEKKDCDSFVKLYKDFLSYYVEKYPQEKNLAINYILNSYQDLYRTVKSGPSRILSNMFEKELAGIVNTKEIWDNLITVKVQANDDVRNEVTYELDVWGKGNVDLIIEKGLKFGDNVPEVESFKDIILNQYSSQKYAESVKPKRDKNGNIKSEKMVISLPLNSLSHVRTYVLSEYQHSLQKSYEKVKESLQQLNDCEITVIDDVMRLGVNIKYKGELPFDELEMKALLKKIAVKNIFFVNDIMNNMSDDYVVELTRAKEVEKKFMNEVTDWVKDSVEKWKVGTNEAESSQQVRLKRSV